MKTNNLITRFLDGRTSPEEERQLRDVLEAQTSLSEEERAVLDLLRLSFPEEDTAALLTEDLSADFEDMTAQTDRSKITKRSPFFTVHSSLFIRRFTAVLSIAAILLIAFLLWPEKQETPITQQEVQPVVAEASQQPISQPIIEEKKDNINLEALPPTGGAGRGARKKDETVMAEVQAKAQPVKKRRKAVRKQGAPGEEPVLTETEQPIHESDIEPMYAQAEEYDTHYQNIQTVHLSSDVVVYVIEASDMPAVSTVPSVRELRARGLRLTNNVRQASQTTVQF